MDVATAIGRLEAAGAEQYRAIYRRHGARDPMYGVLFSTIDAIAREGKRDQALVDIDRTWDRGDEKAAKAREQALAKAGAAADA